MTLLYSGHKIHLIKLQDTTFIGSISNSNKKSSTLHLPSLSSSCQVSNGWFKNVPEPFSKQSLQI